MAEMSTYQKDILRVFDFDLPWNELSKTNILVVGATGLIGSALVYALMINPRRQYKIFATGRDDERAYRLFYSYMKDTAFHYFHYDASKPIDSDVEFDYIIDAASDASPSAFVHNPVEVITANVLGVKHLLDYGKTHQMRRFLYISSGEVYGEGDGRVFTEDYLGYIDSLKPRSCYPMAKRMAENLCVSYAQEYGVNVVIVRPCHIYGPNFKEKDNRVYAQFLRNAICGNNIIMKSTGSQFRSWCYVVDCISAILHVLLNGENSEAYNIADRNSTITIKQLADIIAAICHVSVEYERPDLNEALGFNPVTKSVFSTLKLESLGWAVGNDLKSNFRVVIDYERSKNKCI